MFPQPPTAMPNAKPKPNQQSGYLVHCHRVLPRIVKKAKAFESQKISKRIKKLQSDANEAASSKLAADIQSLQDELNTIKAIEPKILINAAILAFSENNKAVQKKLPKPPKVDRSKLTDQESKALDRLVQSKPLREALEELDPERGMAKPKQLLKRVPKVKPQEPQAEAQPEPEAEEGAQAQWESDDGFGDPALSAPNSSRLKDEDEDEESSEEEAVVQRPQASSRARNAAESTFLPSLAAGFLPAGSDNESDFEEEPMLPQRRNRMGQRARRQLWEEKYGPDAKHVKAQQQAEEIARATTEAKRRARAPKRILEREAVAAGQPPAKKQKTAAAAADEEPSHPSWQAKRKQAQLAQVGAVPTGKKIVFD